MFNSTVLEVAIGLVFCYASVALITSSIYEALASWLGLRSKNLLTGIKSLLNANSAFGDALLHQNSKNQSFSVSFFSPIPASAGADSGHGVASATPPSPAFSPPSTPICYPFSLVLSRAFFRPIPLLVRVLRRWVVVGNSCGRGDQE